jgi:hypothetical protein
MKELEKFRNFTKNNLSEGDLSSEKYIISIQTEYGTLNDIEVYAENESDAFEKALQKAEDAVWSSKLDQIEKS